MNGIQGRYSVIYADPPWRFASFSNKGEGRNATAHYNCMPFAELCRLPVRDHAAPDCVLLLWATDPFLPKALSRLWPFGHDQAAWQSA